MVEDGGMKADMELWGEKELDLDLTGNRKWTKALAMTWA